MKLVKLLLILGLVFVLYLINPTTSQTNWVSDSRQSANKSISYNGTIPYDRTVHITLKTSDHTHTHIHHFNNGGYEIYVDIEGPMHILTSGSIKQIHGEMNCIVSSENDALYGDYTIKRTTTIHGNKSNEDVKKAFRETIINYIIKDLAQL